MMNMRNIHKSVPTERMTRKGRIHTYMMYGLHYSRVMY